MKEVKPDELEEAFRTIGDYKEIALVVSAMMEKQRQELLLHRAGTERINMAYYHAKAAAQVKPIVDEMIRTKQDYEFIYENYPNHSQNTVRLKVDGAIRYLVDHDPDGTYILWRKQIRLRRMPHAFGMYWIRDPNDINNIVLDGSLKALPVTRTIDETGVPERKGFMGQLAEFIANSKENDYLAIKDVKLTNADMEQVHKLFENVRDLFELRVSFDRIIARNGKLKIKEDE